jgi:hypothetical protein
LCQALSFPIFFHTFFPAFVRLFIHSYFSLFLFLLNFLDAFYCWECSSKHGNCSEDSLQAISSHCGQEFNFCAIYKTVLSDGNPGVFTRACTTSCSTPYSTWETRTQNATIRHCLMCCNNEYKCNGFLGDPCQGTMNVQSSFLTLICSLCLLWNILFCR